MRRLPSTRRRPAVPAVAGALAVLIGSALMGASLLAPAAAAQTRTQAPTQTTTPSAAPIDVIEVSGLIDPVEVDFIDHALTKAASDGAQALVIQLNTTGATVSRSAIAALGARIYGSKVPVGIWVGPSGARATGTGGQLLAAAAIVGVAPGSRVGKFGEPLSHPDLVFDFGDATARLRNGTLGAADAKAAGVATVDAPVLGEFIVNMDGLTFGATTLHTAKVVNETSGPRREPDATVKFSKLPLTSRLMHTVASPPVAYLLLTIGLCLLVFEFFTAGVGIAGVVGAGALVLAGYGLWVLPTTWLGLVLIVAGVAGFAIDVQTGVPRFWTGVGTVGYVAGSLLLYDGRSLSWIALLAGIAGILLAMLVGMPTMVRTRFATPTIGREWMIGEMGEATVDVAPDGFVRVRGALWRAHTNRATPVIAGGRVRVIAIDGTVLEIEPEVGGARDHRERRRRGAGEPAAGSSDDGGDAGTAQRN